MLRLTFNSLKAKTLFDWFYFFLLLTTYITFIYLIFKAIHILEWRYYNISLPAWRDIISNDNWFNRIQVECIHKAFPWFLMNGHQVLKNISYILIAIIAAIAIHLIFSFIIRKRWALTHSILLILLLFLITLVYYDVQVAQWLREFNSFLVSYGLPSIYPKGSWFYNIWNNYHQVRIVLGFDTAYSFPQDQLHNVPIHKYNFYKLDETNCMGLHELTDYQKACKIRRDFMQHVLPSITDTLKYKNDPILMWNTYNLKETTPLASVQESYIAIINLISYCYKYSLGLSLASIIFVITIILTLLYSLSFITSLNLKDNEKFSPYECGFEPIHTNARIKFDVLYWIIGILYLIFDLELIFIFPLATILHTLINPIALFVYLIFMILLTLGFIYEWKKGALKLNL